MPNRETSMRNIARAVLARKRIGMRKVIQKIAEWLSDDDTADAFREELGKQGVEIDGLHTLEEKLQNDEDVHAVGK